MAALSVSLSDKMRGFVKSRVQGGDYHNESEYIRDLIRRDQERLANEDALERALVEGAASGFSDRSVLDIMADVESQMRANGEL